MKKVILLALLMPCVAYGQILENFESGSLTQWVQSAENHWKADTSGSLSGKFSLHHFFDNPESGDDRIGIRISDLHPAEGKVKWSFVVKHGYDPSSSNNWSVFLMSDSEPGLMSVGSGTNGFAIGVNLTGSDDTLRLWKVENGILTTVLNCGVNWQTTIGVSTPARIIVERTETGTWNANIYRMNGIQAGQATGFDNELFFTSWFGIQYRYSSTRDRMLWVDDISIDGIFYKDAIAPEITGCRLTGRNSIEIVLSEQPSEDLMIPGNFFLNEDGIKPLSVLKTKPFTYLIEFQNDFKNKSHYSLSVNKLCDNSGNCKKDIIVLFNAVWAERGDVIISEIMADPLPEVSLPGMEYLEITNRTEYSFNMKSWSLLVEYRNLKIPDFTINPADNLILCSPANAPYFAKFGKVVEIYQFPALSDAGMIICISDSTGAIIHGVEYSHSWYGDKLKSSGGWSLEMIDIRFPFFAEGNWSASVSAKGGTPGSANSVSVYNQDNSFSGIVNVFPEDSVSIKLKFSEPVFVLNEKIKSITVKDNPIAGLIAVDPIFREFLIRPAEPLQRGEIYDLKISSDLADFAGNRIEKFSFSFGLPEYSAYGDILFNELLFNPLPGDADYIELFNNSKKIIDASRLLLVSKDDLSQYLSQPIQVSEEKRCILPEDYYAITTDKHSISDTYFSSVPEHLFEATYLPSMNDDKGHLILYNRELNKIDEVYYNDKMHFSLLSDNEGVALEKSGPWNASNEASNWHSASESSGWGTPGAPNSVYVELPGISDDIVFSSSRITPDNDSFEDILVIKMNLTGSGNVVSVMIFDETGAYIRRLASNLYIGPEASVIWDGTADDGTLVNSGIYIVFITLYDNSGKTERWKKACTVIRR